MHAAKGCHWFGSPVLFSSCSIVLVAKVVKSLHSALVSVDFIILKLENRAVFVVVVPITPVMHVAEVVKCLRFGVVIANFIPFESEQFAVWIKTSRISASVVAWWSGSIGIGIIIIIGIVITIIVGIGIGIGITIVVRIGITIVVGIGITIIIIRRRPLWAITLGLFRVPAQRIQETEN